MTPEDEYARRREVEKGRKAQSLLDNAYFKEIVERVRDRLYGQFAESPLDDDRARLHARLTLEMLNGLLKEVRTDAETGRLATEQLKD